MRLALRRGLVTSIERREGTVVDLIVAVAGETRRAIAYPDLTGDTQPGDDVVVNAAALDLGLGSGGFDVVHANLTRGMSTSPEPAPRTMKLNYTPLQHGVVPVEGCAGEVQGAPDPRRLNGRPIAILALHGQLEPVAWAAARRRPDARVGFVQTEGGALPGPLSRAVRDLRRRGLLASHITAGAAFGGESEALTLAGGLVAAFGSLGWDAAIVGPGPGIIGSATRLGHGGLMALDSAHVSLALGANTVLVPRLSAGDPRPRHNGVSHHTETVLDLLLAPVLVASPAEASGVMERSDAMAGHAPRTAPTDLEGYRGSGLSSETMGRSLDDDELFFRAALAGGTVLASEIGSSRDGDSDV